MKKFVVVVFVAVVACAALAGCAKNPFRESVFFTERPQVAGTTEKA